MAYSVAADVDRLLGPYATTRTSTVTTVDLTTLILEIDNQINAVLQGAGVTSVPVVLGDNATFFNYLNSVSLWGSVAQTLMALFPDGTLHEFWQDKYDKALKTLRNKEDIPTQLLGGASDDVPIDTYLTQNTAEEADLGDLEGAHLFSVDNLSSEPW